MRTIANILRWIFFLPLAFLALLVTIALTKAVSNAIYGIMSLREFGWLTISSKEVMSHLFGVVAYMYVGLIVAFDKKRALSILIISLTIAAVLSAAGFFIEKRYFYILLSILVAVVGFILRPHMKEQIDDRKSRLWLLDEVEIKADKPKTL